MFLLGNKIHEKTSKTVKRDEILKTCARFLQFALLIHEKALVFSQSDARNFFICITNPVDEGHNRT